MMRGFRDQKRELKRPLTSASWLHRSGEGQSAGYLAPVSPSLVCSRILHFLYPSLALEEVQSVLGETPAHSGLLQPPPPPPCSGALAQHTHDCRAFALEDFVILFPPRLACCPCSGSRFRAEALFCLMKAYNPEYSIGAGPQFSSWCLKK